MMLVTPQNSNPLYSEILCQVVKHQSWALESLKSINPHRVKSHEDLLALTEHLADVRLDVDVLEMLLGVGVVQTEGGVKPDRDPDSVTHPGHLANLRLLPGMSVQCGLYRHELGVHDVNPVPVSEPDLGVDLDHAPDTVVRPAQVQQVIVPQVPLATWVTLKN